MKKVLSIMILVLSVMVVLSCASKKPITTSKDAENAVKKVLDKFRGDLILTDAETYEVKAGDTLSAIARTKYHNGSYFPLIQLASGDVVLDYDLIDIGMKLTLPDLQKNLDDARAKAKLKEFLIEIAKIEDRRDRPQTADGLRNLSDSL